MVPNDIQTVLEISRIFLIIAAVCTTIFPILYLFSPWYKSHLGRAVMIQSVSIAAALDISVVFNYVEAPSDLRAILFINVVVLSLIASAAVYLSIMLIHYNFNRNEEKIQDGERDAGPTPGEAISE